VGIDGWAEADVHKRQEKAENGAMAQQELTLEELTQAAYRRLLGLVESESPSSRL